jgi:hypothetical protein
MTGVEVRYGDGTMGEVRLVVSKAACFGAAARPRGGYDALPDAQPAICRCSRRRKGAILAPNEPESGECRIIQGAKAVMKTLGPFCRFIGIIVLTTLMGSLYCGEIGFANPIIVGNVPAIGSTIETYDYSTGKLIASFTPDHDFNGRGVEVVGNTVFYTGSGERGPGPPNLHDIYFAPFNGGLGGHDTGFFASPRPDFGIQDLDYHNGVLYALTGYFSGPPSSTPSAPSMGALSAAPSRSRITLIREQTDSRFCRTAIF